MPQFPFIRDLGLNLKKLCDSDACCLLFFCFVFFFLKLTVHRLPTRLGSTPQTSQRIRKAKPEDSTNEAGPFITTYRTE